jgi:hypothetical protein
VFIIDTEKDVGAWRMGKYKDDGNSNVNVEPEPAINKALAMLWQ